MEDGAALEFEPQFEPSGGSAVVDEFDAEKALMSRHVCIRKIALQLTVHTKLYNYQAGSIAYQTEGRLRHDLLFGFGPGSVYENFDGSGPHHEADARATLEVDLTRYRAGLLAHASQSVEVTIDTGSIPYRSWARPRSTTRSH